MKWTPDLIGALAVFTIGSVLLLSTAHFRQLLSNPKDRFHINNIMHDGKSATTMAVSRARRFRGAAERADRQFNRLTTSRRSGGDNELGQSHRRPQSRKG